MCFICASHLVAADNVLTPEEQADGWLLLFDGETTYGWRQSGNADWKVGDGRIIVTEGEQCLLYTTTQFCDYEFKVDFRATPTTNSGIFLRTSPKPQNVTRDCYELNIAPPDNPFPTGSFVGRQKVEGAGADDAWHTYEVRAEGGHWTVVLDGKEVLEYTDPAPSGRGYIGLQHNSGQVEFKNVKLKPLGLQSLFNGKDLTGWKTYPDMKSEFTVNEEGHLHVANGLGQLETENSYDNFVFQMDCFSNGRNLNSGVFFRCIPGEQMNGYECQIHNGFEGTRDKPLDTGTGGIFRRTTARRVVTNDFEWFRLTIIADGPHISTWANGYQVTDWSDTRKPNANPRRGLRVEPGTIMIQGHDPTTDLSFRNIVIGRMKPRWPGKSAAFE
ncbi:MAG: DUF1080 domain-containing protein [Planctomycetales bacterium]|nr:DUF1080 domain-containing protein [Planctomycetales bacterium]